MPGDGHQPHLLSWEEGRANALSLDAHDAFTRLSPSELDVLNTAARGLTTTESARHLRKGTETVKTQRRQIILKLGARNIANAVAIAASRGILTIDQDESEMHGLGRGIPDDACGEIRAEGR
jgi:DNA-binding CsgD family transcriptional regulator